MHSLAAIDLNLILPLHALLEEQSVTRAAKRVGLSQPAMSHALGRLRSHLDDPLLVRSGRVMLITPRGQALREAVRVAIGHLEDVLVALPWDPVSMSTTQRVVADDYVGFVLLPEVIARVSAAAPGVDVEVQPRGKPGRKALLRRGETDLALGYFSAAGMDLHRETLFTEDWVSVTRRGHRLARRRTTAQWARAAHIVISPTGGRRGAVDRALEQRGLERRVALTLPYFLSAFPVLAASDYVLTVGRRLGTALAALHDLATFKPPLELAPYEVCMLWHPRTHHDDAQRWFRETVADVAESQTP